MTSKNPHPLRVEDRAVAVSRSWGTVSSHWLPSPDLRAAKPSSSGHKPRILGMDLGGFPWLGTLHVGFSRETSWLLGYHHRKYPFHSVLGGPDGSANWHGSPTFLPQHPSSTGHSCTVLQVTLGHSCGLLRGVFSMPSSYESGLKPLYPCWTGKWYMYGISHWYMVKGSLVGETSVLRTFRMSGKELVKERVSQRKS